MGLAGAIPDVQDFSGDGWRRSLGFGVGELRGRKRAARRETMR